MTDRELRKLSRAELLEMLIVQTEEVDRLREELAAMQARLRDRNMMLEKAGNIAEAALRVNNVFTAAQFAAEQYLDNIQKMEHESREACLRMKKQTRQECEQMKEQARQECAAMVHQAQQETKQLWKEVGEKVKQPYQEHLWWHELMQMLDEHTGK